MDVYHKVLVQLFEETGGNDSKAVDFPDLVKRMGFHANYRSIFKELSVQGWVVETSKVDWVKITHWGIQEAKKSKKGGTADSQELKKHANRLLAETRELVELLENLSADVTKDNFAGVEKKHSDIGALVAGLKSKF
jgi:phage anti-repressor protein